MIVCKRSAKAPATDAELFSPSPGYTSAGPTPPHWTFVLLLVGELVVEAGLHTAARHQELAAVLRAERACMQRLGVTVL